jgi:type VI secretion system protein ImpE
MNLADAAERSLRDRNPKGALQQLQQAVRADPSDSKLRIFLFQLLSVLGQWERALNQLNVAAELDPAALAMAQVYGAALHCEVLRGEVFQGKKAPMVFGEPDQWLALLIESLLLAGQEKHREAEILHAKAFDAAGPTSGTIDGRRFEWIADADARLGPVCEAIINGRYYWLPFSHLQVVVIDEPQDLRDMVWMPAHLQFDNGGESVALIPTRYPGTEKRDEGELLLARKTIWIEAAPGSYHGIGQRLLATDRDEIPLMDVRRIIFGADDKVLQNPAAA